GLFSKLYPFSCLGMSQESPQFVFMTCRAGAESALKREVALIEPSWHPSFSRPGFLTFKNTGKKPIDTRRLAEQNWTFAHACGISFGRLAGEQLAEMVAQFWTHPGIAAFANSDLPLDVHVWQREPMSEQACGLDEYVTPLCVEIECAIRSAAPETI